MGHYALAKKAVKYDYVAKELLMLPIDPTESAYVLKTVDCAEAGPAVSVDKRKGAPGVDASGNLYLLLFLSVTNADNPIVPPFFEHRLYMMYLMARHWHKETKVDVSIGIPRYANFVYKLVITFKKLLHAVKLTFAVELDTLVLNLDEKYYLPDKLVDTFCKFMKTPDLFCFTRAKSPELSIEQIRFLRNVHHGKFAHVPL